MPWTLQGKMRDVSQGSEMPHPLQEKGHWDLWAPGKVAATGIQVRGAHEVTPGHFPGKVFQVTEDIFIAPT